MKLFCKLTLAIVLAGLPTIGAAQQPGNLLQGLTVLPNYQSERVSSTDPDWQHGNADARPIAPGATLVLANLEGPGEITHFWNTVAVSERHYSRILILRMYWDGEKQPSVEAPLGDFFGVGHGIDANLDSLPVRDTSDGRARNCYWVMPFHKSALITVTNEGTAPVDAFYYQIDWRKMTHLPTNTPTFHASYRQEYPCIAGKPYVIANISGAGEYVGTVLSVRQLTGGWWGEGNDYFYVDGESTPSIKGTGSEDYFNDGWGLHKGTGLFTGTPVMQGNDAGDKTTAYRWHIPDPVAFKHSLRVTIQHMGVTFHKSGAVKTGFGERFDDFSSVAFWYQTGEHLPYPPMPYGRKLLYHDFANIVEGESLVGAAKANHGTISVQNLGGYCGGAQLWYTPHRPDGILTLPLNVAAAGSYEFLALCTYAHDYGTYQFSIDGHSLGNPVDFYHNGIEEHSVVFPHVALTAGNHTLTITNTGKNQQSVGYMWGLDGYLLTQEPQP